VSRKVCFESLEVLFRARGSITLTGVGREAGSGRGPEE